MMKEPVSSAGSRHSSKGSRRTTVAGMWLAGWAIIGGSSGCAVHYLDPRTGAEHLWGVGQLRLQTNSCIANSAWAAVTSGVRAPGLCLSLGKNRFGLTLGYFDQQRLTVIPASQLAGLQSPTNTWPGLMARAANARWACGHLHMRSAGEPQHHWVIVTGKALLGFNASMGDDNRLGVLLHSRQTALVQRESIHLEFDQDAPRWPGFDLFAIQVQLPHEDLTPTTPTHENP